MRVNRMMAGASAGLAAAAAGLFSTAIANAGDALSGMVRERLPRRSGGFSAIDRARAADRRRGLRFIGGKGQTFSESAVIRERAETKRARRRERNLRIVAAGGMIAT